MRGICFFEQWPVTIVIYSTSVYKEIHETSYTYAMECMIFPPVCVCQYKERMYGVRKGGGEEGGGGEE